MSTYSNNELFDNLFITLGIKYDTNLKVKVLHYKRELELLYNDLKLYNFNLSYNNKKFDIIIDIDYNYDEIEYQLEDNGLYIISYNMEAIHNIIATKKMASYLIFQKRYNIVNGIWIKGVRNIYIKTYII